MRKQEIKKLLQENPLREVIGIVYCHAFRREIKAHEKAQLKRKKK